MKKSNNNINTGKILDDYLTKNRIAKASLGRKINRDRVSVLRYTQNISIQTGILLDICHALKYNFFQDLANALPRDFAFQEVIDTERIAIENERQALIEKLKNENNTLKIQNELLMKIKG